MHWIRFDDDDETRILLCCETGANFRVGPNGTKVFYSSPDIDNINQMTRSFKTAEEALECFNFICRKTNQA